MSMHLVVLFDEGDPEGRVSAVMCDVEAIEQFKGGWLRVKEYEKVTKIEHVREFEVTNHRGDTIMHSVRTDDEEKDDALTIP